MTKNIGICYKLPNKIIILKILCMIYVGIVGSCSPLGLKVIDALSNDFDKYRIVFCVDRQYKVNTPSKATYASVEAALSFNQPPTVLIDCDNPDGTLDRAKIYRFYAVSAIMCCACSSDELDTVSRVFGVEEVLTPSLITVPDFSVCNTRLMAFFLRIGAGHINDIDRLEIDVRLPEGGKLDVGVWVGWAHLFNALYGIEHAKVSVKGSSCYCGKVIINAITDSALPINGEEIHVRMFYGQQCCIYMKTFCENLLVDCLNGIEKLLAWFNANTKQIEAGKVFINHLNTIMYENKKNLP
ncbi:MAG: hypothetical protein IJ677_03185 [Alphaproteobacteria bacterium]|nr:hypothetical protein [Alphaproteobacteria bacterium]